MTAEEWAAGVYPPPIIGAGRPDTDCLRGIADRIRMAVAEERDACAVVVEHFLVKKDQSAVSWHEVQDALHAIRARGSAGPRPG